MYENGEEMKMNVMGIRLCNQVECRQCKGLNTTFRIGISIPVSYLLAMH